MNKSKKIFFSFLMLIFVLLLSSFWTDPNERPELDTIIGTSETGTIIPNYDESCQYVPKITFNYYYKINVNPYETTYNNHIHTWELYDSGWNLITDVTYKFKEDELYRLKLRLSINYDDKYVFTTSTKIYIDDELWTIESIDGGEGVHESSCVIYSPEFSIVAPYFDVTFESNGGTSINLQHIKYGEKATKPEDPTKEGYQFEGWYLDNNLFDFNSLIYEDIKLSAKWSKLYNISFNTFGGTSIENQIIKEGNKVTKPQDPTKEDYIFDGWYYGNNLFDFNEEIHSDKIIYAKWKRYQIDSIKINIIEPKLGNKPDINPIIISNPRKTFKEDIPISWYKIPFEDYDNINYFNLSSYEMNINDLYEIGYYYFVKISLNSKDYYEFSENTIITINDNEINNKFFNFYDESNPKLCLIGNVFYLNKLISIELLGDYQKEFYINDIFNYDGLIVKANYQDSSYRYVNNYEISGYQMDKIGYQDIIIKYEEDGIIKTTSYQINVKEKEHKIFTLEVIIIFIISFIILIILIILIIIICKKEDKENKKNENN